MKFQSRINKHKGMRDLINNRNLYFMVLPAVLFSLIFAYLPMVGLVIAFQDFNPMKGLFHSKFVGVDNFKFFFAGHDWLIITLNTIYLNMLFIVSGTIVALTIAIVLTELGRNAVVRVIQSVMILPNFITWPTVGLFSVAFLSTDTGVINQLYKYITDQTLDVYISPGVWPTIFVLINIWKGAGFGAIVYMAAIIGIDKELYEAAKMDGANRLQQIFRITLPLLKSTIVILFLLSLGNIFVGNLEMIFSLIGDNSMLYSTTDVIDTYVFRSIRTSGSMGMTAAIGLYQSIVGFTLVLLCNKLTKRYDKESAIF
ncbi:sugar ABC transporter permease [Paenibacillus baekrokdamisoli]|uniref:Sugar ABC transporter permease n=1 Tax=Paenibacillus baekrokdamisoli TaxID=1712516 RepID=A0A3G9JJA7_9BACL|nr:ABC transporter permease subunit [Paenibacillus baekrokdamisoli]MBB3067889.1 putative aldouronate transport system permease protein [Paenibacillus baekrokdamisoli]BBH23064.1 sugar ABC transporter permease [Paenibacillus baekrokdamisoli]